MGFLVAAVSVGVMLTPMMIATSASAETLPVSGQSASEELSASMLALKTGVAVPIDSETTPTSQVSAQPDGTMKLVSNSLPVRVKQGGTWIAVDTKLSSSSGWLEPTASATPVLFSVGGSGPMAKVQTSSGKWLSESWPYGDLPVPKISGDSATYPEVLPDVDLRLTATSAGMSEVFIIKNAKAAANPKVQSIELKISGAILSQDSRKSTTASASDKSTVVSSSPIWWDSSNSAAGSGGPGGDGEVQPVNQTVSDDSVTLDLQSITASTVATYPIYVDPDWSAGQQAFWFTDRAYPNVSYLNGANAAGYQSLGAATQSGISYMSRAFWEFGTSALVGKQILNAVFNATETLSTCGNTSLVQMYRYGPASAGFTWNQDPGAWNQLLDAELLPYGNSCHPAQMIGLSATAGVAYVAAAGGGSIQLGLRSSDETSLSSRKHFAYGASLTVSYNSIPGTPAAPTYTSPSRTCSTDPANPTPLDGTQPITMEVTANDPDTGQNVTTQFSVSGVSPTSFSWAQSTPSQAAGPASVTVPANTMSPGGVYTWHAQTNDGAGGVSPVSANCYFRIVTSSPGLPTVTETSSSAAVVGQAMTILFGSAANDGVRLFAYWWAAGSGTTPPAPPVITPIVPGQALPTCGSASGSVRFVCPDSGTFNAANVTVAPVDTVSTLWVASYNDAGRVSLASTGQYGATGLHVSASADTTGVSNSVGHIWDSENITTSATSVPDLNTTTGTSGSTTRQPLGAPLSLLAGDFEGIPTTLLNYTTASIASMTAREAIDTMSSFTVSAWLYASPTAAAGVAHVAMSQFNSNNTAFTLGTGINGALTFCRTSQVNQAQVCVVGPAIVPGSWTLVTGVWDAANQNLRVLENDFIVPKAVASQPVPPSDTNAGGGLCVGGKCSMNSGSFVTSQPWDGQIFRPAAFPGVVSSAQLKNLYNVLSPNDDPPANESIGAVVNLACANLITPQNMYDYNPNFSNISGWTPAAGTSAQQAVQWNGLACHWINDTSNDPIDVSVASIVDRGTMVQLRAEAAAAGTPVSNLGDAAYFQTIGGDGELQVFAGNYWLTFRSPWFGGGNDADPLPADALANLP